MMVPLIVSAVAVFVLGSLAGPTIFPGDTTEFLAAVLGHGVPHAPGYPLLVLVGRAALALPLGPEVYRLNLVSAFAVAGATGIVGAIILDLTRSRLAAVFGACAFFLTPVVALYGRWFETFPLHALLVASILLVILRFLEKPSPRLLSAAALLFGLGMSNHHTAVLLLPVLVGAAWARRGVLNPRTLFGTAGCFILGLLPYAVIPYLATGDPYLNWGDATTPRALLDLFLRRDYGTGSLIADVATSEFRGSAAEFSLQDLWRQTGFIVVIAGFGSFALLRDRMTRARGAALAASFVLLGPLFMLISRTPISGVARAAIIERFMIAPFLILAVFAGAGLAAVVRHRIARWGAPVLILALITPLRITLAQSLLPAGDLYESVSREQLRSLPADAIYLVARDTDAMAAEYWRVRGIRTDVRVIRLVTLSAEWYRRQIAERYPELSYAVTPDAAETVRRLCEREGESGKIYIADAWAEGALLASACWPLPRGWVYELMPPSARTPLSSVRDDQEALWNDFETQWREPLARFRPLDRRTRQLLAELASFRRSVATVYRAAGREEWAKEEDARAAFLSGQ